MLGTVFSGIVILLFVGGTVCKPPGDQWGTYDERTEDSFNLKLSDEAVYQDILLDDVLFLLYTRKSNKDGFRLYIDDAANLQVSGFNKSLPLKIAAHGFLNDYSSLQKIKNEMLDMGDFNFIIVDWSKCSKKIRYKIAVVCSKTVGHYTAQLLQFIMRETRFDIKNLHLLGHSLGAQAMSFVSDYFKDPKIPRISAFDPAGPLFEHVEPSERLDPTDADFVDVIHTSIMLWGFKAPIGTVDFYPNSGNNQPGCSSTSLNCSHGKATAYFVATIPESERDKYMAFKCSSLVEAINGTCQGAAGIMGYDAPRSSPGIYYIKVTEAP